MKQLIVLLSLSALVFLQSCGGNSTAKESNKDQETTIIGKWRLTKKGQKENENQSEAKQPTQVVMDLQKNGFFIVYDTFLDPEWKKKGLPLIQEITKGQWTFEKSTLTLNHQTPDTTYTETFNVSSVSNETLITKGSNKQTTIYRTYGR